MRCVLNSMFQLAMVTISRVAQLSLLLTCVSCGSAFAVELSQDPPKVTIEATTGTAFEDGSVDGVLLVSRSGSTTQALTVHLRISGNATNGVDYLTIANEAQIPSGASSVELRVKPINDTEIETDELVTVGLADAAINSTFDKTLASVSIKDNDTVVQIETLEAIGTESGSKPIVFRVTRNGNFRIPLTVNYSLSGSTTTADGQLRTISDGSSNTVIGDGSVRTISPAVATPGVDFPSLPASITFQLGETSKLISVTPTDDTKVEAREAVTITLLKSPLYTLGIRAATGFIEDNDSLPLPVVQVIVSGSHGSEAGLRPVVFRFDRTSSTTEPLTVNYTVGQPGSSTGIQDGSSNTILIGERATTATSGVDFAPAPGAITFQQGQSSVTLNIVPVDDSVVENTESVVVTLVPQPSYTLGVSRSASGFIDDNDQTSPVPVAALVAMSLSQPIANEDSSSNGVVSVTRSGSLAQALTVSYSINAVTSNIQNPATNGVDFDQLSGQVVIPAGINSATISIHAIDDNEQEPEERVVVALVPSTNGTYTIDPGNNSVVVRIKDHHRP